LENLIKSSLIYDTTNFIVIPTVAVGGERFGAAGGRPVGHLGRWRPRGGAPRATEAPRLLWRLHVHHGAVYAAHWGRRGSFFGRRVFPANARRCGVPDLRVNRNFFLKVVSDVSVKFLFFPFSCAGLNFLIVNDMSVFSGSYCFFPPEFNRCFIFISFLLHNIIYICK